MKNIKGNLKHWLQNKNVEKIQYYYLKKNCIIGNKRNFYQFINYKNNHITYPSLFVINCTICLFKEWE